MPSPNGLDDLRQLVLSLQLASPSAWDAYEAELRGGESIDTLLTLAEQRHLLTTLQVTRIRKQEIAGLVLGGYKLMYRNASGSFARVFRAEHIATRHVVAMKVLRERWVDDADMVAGFHREAQLCRRFRHPNIVPIYDVGSEGQFHYFTMEFVEGGNLRDFLNIRGKLSPEEASRCTLEICRGLAYALSMGATHRDLKLTNVLMSSTGVSKLVDFGLAGDEDRSGIVVSGRNVADDIQRALEYAALERGTHAPRSDPRSDIFFAGAIFYELLCGRPSWPRTRDREERRQLSRYTNVTPLSIIEPTVPDKLVRIVERMMQVSPNARYQTCAEVVIALEEAMTALGYSYPSANGDKKDNENGDQDRRLMILEVARKRQKILNNYFSSRGFNVVFVTEFERAIKRLKSRTPPDAMLLMLDDVDNVEEMCARVPEIQAYGRQLKRPCLSVFAEDAKEQVQRKLLSTRFGRVLFQPLTLKELRATIVESLAR